MIFIHSCQNSSTESLPTIYQDDDKLSRVDSMFYYDGNIFSGLVVQKLTEVETNFEINVLDGKYHGVFKESFLGGQKRSLLNYSNGLLDGLQQGWHHNGNLSYSYKAKNGKQVGEYLEYFPNGHLQIKRYFENGKIVKNKIYDIYGKVIVNYVVRDGRTYGLLGSSSCVTVLNEDKD